MRRAAHGPARSYGDGARRAVPVAIAVLAFGITFGVLAREAGIGPLAAILMSATTLAGSAQFAAASVLAAGGGASTAVLAAALLNVRYLPIGVSVAPWLEGSLLRRLLTAHLIVDESWAIAADGPGRWNPRVLVGAGTSVLAAWVGGTAIGVASGDLLGDPTRFGLDAAFPALFVALLAPQLRSAGARLAAALGATIALALVPLSAPGVPIVAATAAALVGLRSGRSETPR
ncbi:MAG: hypothetical protein KatS3mg013_0803 [Actinomycetota bacterium]|nr:MAG: hypothetical protein KatS3mg013_0803 [Actinomycetota bacterium]